MHISQVRSCKSYTILNNYSYKQYPEKWMRAAKLYRISGAFTLEIALNIFKKHS